MAGIEQLLLSVDETRKVLGGRGRGHVYALIEDGKLESVKDGSRRFILAESVRRYVVEMPRDFSRRPPNFSTPEITDSKMIGE